MIYFMVMDRFFIWMGVFMKVNGLLGNVVDGVKWNLRMDRFILVNGLMITDMDRGNCFCVCILNLFNIHLFIIY